MSYSFQIIIFILRGKQLSINKLQQQLLETKVIIKTNLL